MVVMTVVNKVNASLDSLSWTLQKEFIKTLPQPPFLVSARLPHPSHTRHSLLFIRELIIIGPPRMGGIPRIIPRIGPGGPPRLWIKIMRFKDKLIFSSTYEIGQ